MDASAKKSDNKIFVIGHARSGTTFLFDFLNTDKNAFILGEADIYWRHLVPAFPEYFNRENAKLGRSWVKGHYIPPCIPSDMPGRDVLNKLAEFYTYVGDKIALGPNRPEQSIIWQYYAAEYFHSNYIFTFRDPIAAVISMRRMFPEESFRNLIAAWLQTAEFMIRFMSFLPNVYMLPTERFSARVLKSLNDRLGLNAIVVGEAIKPPPGADISAVEEIDEFERATLQKAKVIYSELNYTWNAQDFSCFYAQSYYEYWRHYSREVAGMLRSLDVAQPGSAEAMAYADPRRAIYVAYLGSGYFKPQCLSITEDYLSDYPENGEANYAMGLMLSDAGQYDKALEYLNAADARWNRPFWVRYQRGLVHWKMQNAESAIKDLEAALSVVPEDEAAQQALAEVKASVQPKRVRQAS
jgi:tetratricopeptide (TPR) repeat protein